MNNVRQYLLFSAAGASREYLGQCPATEHVKYQCIGALVCLTSLAACCSMYTAVSMTWEQDKWWQTTATSLPIAVLWAAFIFFLDRFVVSSMRPHDTFSARLRQAIPRIVLGIVIGVIISRPIEIKIFETEILRVLEADYFVHSERYRKIAEDKVVALKRSFYLEYADEQKRLLELKAELDDRTKRAEQVRSDLQRSIDKAANEASDEEAGRGSPKSGRGPVYRGIKERETELRNRLAIAENELAESTTERNVAYQQLESLDRIIDGKVSAKTKELNKEQSDLKRKLDNLKDHGFLDLNVGLSILAGKGPAGRSNGGGTGAPISSAIAANSATDMASPASNDDTSDIRDFYQGSVVSEVLWAISIFFVLIEIIPVLMKLLTPPGPYDVFLRKEMASAEEHHLKLMESVKRVRHAFLKCYEDTNRSAFERVFGAVGREFENLNEGRGKKVFSSVWDQIASRLHATMSQVDREHERPPQFGVEFPPPSPGLNTDEYAPPKLPHRRHWRPVRPSRMATLIGAGAFTFVCVSGSAWLLRGYEVHIEDAFDISIGIGTLIMTVLTTMLSHHRSGGAASFGGINDTI